VRNLAQKLAGRAKISPCILRDAMGESATGLRILEEEIIHCRRCPRLVEYREKVAKEKRRAFREWSYWGRPVPGFGDARAEMFILGLAPGAHGSNRTGRMFTGDRSGEFLYAALHKCDARLRRISRCRQRS
jgi:uracil-DNA glycosylase